MLSLLTFSQNIQSVKIHKYCLFRKQIIKCVQIVVTWKLTAMSKIETLKIPKMRNILEHNTREKKRINLSKADSFKPIIIHFPIS